MGMNKSNVYYWIKKTTNTVVSWNSRQIVGFDVAYDKSPERIQRIVDNSPYVENYCTDGFLGGRLSM